MSRAAFSAEFTRLVRNERDWGNRAGRIELAIPS